MFRLEGRDFTGKANFLGNKKKNKINNSEHSINLEEFQTEKLRALM